MRNASGHQCKEKMSDSEKKVNENVNDISSIKKFLEVLRCSPAKQRQRNVQNKKTPEGAYAGCLGLRKNYGYVG